MTNSTTLAQLFGDREVFPHQAIELFDGWFDSLDIVVLTGMEPPLQQIGPRPRLQSVRITAKKFREEMLREGGAEKLGALCADIDLYFAVAPVKKGTSGPRLVRNDITYLPGITQDLDVKEGAFESEEQIMEFLGSLEKVPSFTVSTGSGGVHAYWKFDEAVPLSEGEKLIRAWWAYTNEIAHSQFGADIDRLIDATRMLRVPGTLRYPKVEGETVLPVTLTGVTGETISPAEIYELTQSAVQRRDDMLEETRVRNQELMATRKIEIPEGIEGAEDNKWVAMMNVVSQDAQIDEWIDSIEWATILMPLGWTFLRVDENGSEHWARPGSQTKSASVNWPPSPNVMALHSTSVETGLSDLHEAGIPLSKKQVLLRLFFQDDIDAMYDWVTESMEAVDNVSKT